MTDDQKSKSQADTVKVHSVALKRWLRSGGRDCSTELSEEFGLENIGSALSERVIQETMARHPCLTREEAEKMLDELCG